MAFYRECFFCGAALDSGEKCDCREEEQRKKIERQKLIRTQNDGQMIMVLPTTAYVQRHI